MCMDGAAQNRAFINMMFDGDPRISEYTIKNKYDPSKQIVLLMDPSHNFKKLRNSLLSSGLVKKGSEKARRVIIKGTCIYKTTH